MKSQSQFQKYFGPLVWLALENLEIIRGMIECWRLKSDKLLQVVCNFSPVNKTNGSADLSQINHGNDNNRPKVWIMLCSIVFPSLCSTTELEPGLLDTDFFTRLIKINDIFFISAETLSFWQKFPVTTYLMSHNKTHIFNHEDTIESPFSWVLL